MVCLIFLHLSFGLTNIAGYLFVCIVKVCVWSGHLVGKAQQNWGHLAYTLLPQKLPTSTWPLQALKCALSRPEATILAWLKRPATHEYTLGHIKPLMPALFGKWLCVAGLCLATALVHLAPCWTEEDIKTLACNNG